MILVCQLVGESGIYDDGDYWVTTDRRGVSPSKKLKKDFPFYPLAAVLKYNAKPVNQEILERLGELARELQKEDNP